MRRDTRRAVSPCGWCKPRNPLQSAEASPPTVSEAQPETCDRSAEADPIADLRLECPRIAPGARIGKRRAWQKKSGRVPARASIVFILLCRTRVSGRCSRAKLQGFLLAGNPCDCLRPIRRLLHYQLSNPGSLTRHQAERAKRLFNRTRAMRREFGKSVDWLRYPLGWGNFLWVIHSHSWRGVVTASTAAASIARSTSFCEPAMSHPLTSMV